MNILFMIGNGFDKNLGLNTSYIDFYEYYVKLPSSNEVVKVFKDDLKKNNYVDWSDLELALGEYSSNFKKEEDYILLINDIIMNLKEYLIYLVQKLLRK